MPINRGPFNALIDDDGTNTLGSVWNKAAIKDVILDPVDAAIAGGGGSVTLPIDLTTQVTGTLQAAQEPAHTGDVTNAAGSLALAIGALKVTAAMLAGNIPWAKLTVNDDTIAQRLIARAQMDLTDGPSVLLDVGARADSYRLFATGDRTIVPTGLGTNNQRFTIEHIASGGAPRTLSLQTGVGGGFRFGSDIPALTPTAAGKSDYIGVIFNQTAMRWDVIAYTKGF